MASAPATTAQDEQLGKPIEPRCDAAPVPAPSAANTPSVSKSGIDQVRSAQNKNDSIIDTLTDDQRQLDEIKKQQSAFNETVSKAHNYTQGARKQVLSDARQLDEMGAMDRIFGTTGALEDQKKRDEQTINDRQQHEDKMKADLAESTRLATAAAKAVEDAQKLEAAGKTQEAQALLAEAKRLGNLSLDRLSGKAIDVGKEKESIKQLQEFSAQLERIGNHIDTAIVVTRYTQRGCNLVVDVGATCLGGPAVGAAVHAALNTAENGVEQGMDVHLGLKTSDEAWHDFGQAEKQVAVETAIMLISAGAGKFGSSLLGKEASLGARMLVGGSTGLVIGSGAEGANLAWQVHEAHVDFNKANPNLKDADREKAWTDYRNSHGLSNGEIAWKVSVAGITGAVAGSVNSAIPKNFNPAAKIQNAIVQKVLENKAVNKVVEVISSATVARYTVNVASNVLNLAATGNLNAQNSVSALAWGAVGSKGEAHGTAGKTAAVAEPVSAPETVNVAGVENTPAHTSTTPPTETGKAAGATTTGTSNNTSSGNGQTQTANSNGSTQTIQASSGTPEGGNVQTQTATNGGGQNNQVTGTPAPAPARVPSPAEVVLQIESTDIAHKLESNKQLMEMSKKFAADGTYPAENIEAANKAMTQENAALEQRLAEIQTKIDSMRQTQQIQSDMQAISRERAASINAEADANAARNKMTPQEQLAEIASKVDANNKMLEQGTKLGGTISKEQIEAVQAELKAQNEALTQRASELQAKLNSENQTQQIQSDMQAINRERAASIQADANANSAQKRMTPQEQLAEITSKIDANNQMLEQGSKLGGTVSKEQVEAVQTKLTAENDALKQHAAEIQAKIDSDLRTQELRAESDAISRDQAAKSAANQTAQNARNQAWNEMTPDEQLADLRSKIDSNNKVMKMGQKYLADGTYPAENIEAANKSIMAENAELQQRKALIQRKFAPIPWEDVSGALSKSETETVWREMTANEETYAAADDLFLKLRNQNGGTITRGDVYEVCSKYNVAVPESLKPQTTPAVVKAEPQVEFTPKENDGGEFAGNKYTPDNSGSEPNGWGGGSGGGWRDSGGGGGVATLERPALTRSHSTVRFAEPEILPDPVMNLKDSPQDIDLLAEPEANGAYTPKRSSARRIVTPPQRETTTDFAELEPQRQLQEQRPAPRLRPVMEREVLPVFTIPDAPAEVQPEVELQPQRQMAPAVAPADEPEAAVATAAKSAATPEDLKIVRPTETPENNLNDEPEIQPANRRASPPPPPTKVRPREEEEENNGGGGSSVNSDFFHKHRPPEYIWEYLASVEEAQKQQHAVKHSLIKANQTGLALDDGKGVADSNQRMIWEDKGF